MVKDYTIGVDLGGTNLRAAAIDGSGTIIDRRATPVVGKSAAAVVDAVIAQVSALENSIGSKVRGIGLGVPGIVDWENGVVHASPHFPEWSDVPIREFVARAVDRKVCMDNDANCHAFAESRLGAGKGLRNMVMLTLGTGLGGGLILDGKLFHGDSGFAGEVGHIVVEPEGEACGCSGRGCLERYAASHAFRLHASRLDARVRDELLREAGVSLDALTPEIAARLAENGNAAAIGLWREFGRYLGVGIATMVNVLGVLTFVIGGGITKSWDKFIDSAKASALEHTYERHAAFLGLRRAKFSNDAGVIGAALQARDLI